MRVLKIHYIIDSGDQATDDNLCEQIEKTAKMQKRMISTDKVLMLVGDEIATERSS